MMTLEKLRSILLVFVSLFFFLELTHATDRRGRLGVGMSNQMVNNLPSLSFKLQKSKSFGIGGLIGLSTNDNGGGHAAGLKVYRNLFDEPQLSFFGAMTGAMVKQKSGTQSQSGFQLDATLGSEFSFNGLQSIGFSFEFGLSFNKLNDFVVETVGNNFIVSAVHFYL
jgi:hypothetical protein